MLITSCYSFGGDLPLWSTNPIPRMKPCYSLLSVFYLSAQWRLNDFSVGDFKESSDRPHLGIAPTACGNKESVNMARRLLFSHLWKIIDVHRVGVDNCLH